MRRIRFQRFTPLIGLFLFLFALYVLKRALGENGYQQIFRAVAQYPSQRILGAIGLTAASYALLTLYDHLALRYLRQSIGLVRVSLASFINYCFSRNIGFALLTGGSIRYRFYSAWGLSAEEIARLIAFAAMTFIVGLLTAGGTVLLLSPATLPALPYPVWTLGPLGALALSLVFAYLLLVFLRRRPFRIRHWEILLPTPSQSLAQVLIGTCDWLLKAGILYYLLSEIVPLTLVSFLEVYLVAQVIATLSHVPGGLGVFETAVVMLIPELSAADLLATLLVYRGIYFLLPFCCAILLLGGLETLQHAKIMQPARLYKGRWLSSLAPPVYAAAVLMSAAILLFSCTTPTMSERLEWLRGAVPLFGVELSHFFLGVSSAALILFARGLQRRLRRSFVATLLLLFVSAMLTLVKGVTYEQAIMLVLVAVALLPGRDLFYRRLPLREETFPLGWITVILIVLGAALWLVAISYEPQTFTIQRFFSFSLEDDAGRSLRAMVGAAAVFAGFVLLKLRMKRIPGSKLPDLHALEAARWIISRQPTASANLALLGDKKLLFSKGEDAFLMYAESGRFRVALGDPVGARPQLPELAWCFQEMCERDGKLSLFYQVEEEALSIYLDMGMTLFKCGERASLLLATEDGEKWPEENARGEFRFEVQEVPLRQLQAVLQQLAGRWPARGQNTGSGPSQKFFPPSSTDHFPLAIVYRGEDPVAFALILEGVEKEMAIDFLRFSPRIGPRAADILLHGLKDWGASRNFQRLELGMMPDFDGDQGDLCRHWRDFGLTVFRNGGSFSSLGEMHTWLARLQTRMRPCYLAFPGGISPLNALESTAALVRESTFFLRWESASPRSGQLYCETDQ